MMQPIDNKSLDILFSSQQEQKKPNFADLNKTLMSEVRRMGLKVVDKIQNQAGSDIKTTEIEEESFERTVKEKVDSKTENKKPENKKNKIEEELILVNTASTQILDDVEDKLGIDFSLRASGSSFKPTQSLQSELTVDIVAKIAELENLDSDIVAKIAELENLDTEIVEDIYEEDLSDLNLSLLPFAALKADALNEPQQSEEAKLPLEVPLNLRLDLATKISEDLSIDIEETTKLIAQIDLNTATGVDEILELSNHIEKLSQIKEAVDSQIVELEKQIQNLELPKSQEHGLKALSPEAKLLVDSRLAEFVKAYKELDKESVGNINNPSMATIKAEESLKIEKEMSYRSQVNQTLEFKDRIEILETKITYDENLDLEKEAKISASENVNMFSSLKFGSSMGQNTNSNSGNSQQAIVQAVQQTMGDSRVMSARAQVINQPIQMERLPNLIAEKATQVPRGVKQDLKLFLNPEKMGGIELSISKEGNNLDIKMSFTNEEAMKRLETKLNELKVLLRSRGFETKIELSHTGSNNSSSDTARQHSGNGTFNEAREEQKQRYSDRPSWLDEDISSDEPSFEEAYEGITQ